MDSEQAALQDAVRGAINQADEPQFYIIDLTETNLDFASIMKGSNTGARESDSVWRSDKVREVVFVSENEAVHAVVAGLRHKAFGNFEAPCFHTFDEATSYIQNQVSG